MSKRFLESGYEASKTVKATNEWATATRPMVVTVNGKTYQADLQANLGPAQWERLYLEEGFRIPGTGQIIPPGQITSISVRSLDSSPLKPFPSEGALAWLESQVEQTCALGREL